MSGLAHNAAVIGEAVVITSLAVSAAIALAIAAAEAWYRWVTYRHRNDRRVMEPVQTFDFLWHEWTPERDGTR